MGTDHRADLRQSLEGRIRSVVAAGNDHFFSGNYTAALDAYLQAYALLHGYLEPDVPVDAVIRVIDRVRGLDLLQPLLSASAEVARLRGTVGAGTPIVAPKDPPAKFTEVVRELRRAGAHSRPSPARMFYDAAVRHLRAGAVEQAEQLLNRAGQQGKDDDDPRLDADVSLAHAAVLVQRGNAEGALGLLREAGRRYEELGAPVAAAAANNNLGVASTVLGDLKTAGAAFNAAGARAPVTAGHSLTQQFEMGAITAMQRPTGADGLRLMLPANDPAEAWVTVRSLRSAGEVRRWGVLAGGKVVDLDLRADPVTELTNRIYQERVGARTLEALRTHDDLEGNFVAYLGHLYGFVLPMSIGDCHVRLKDFTEALTWYGTAQSYRFLNLAVEAPVLWQKTAETVMSLAHDRYAAGDIDAARAQYRKIIRLEAPQVDPASPLYAPTVFAGMRTQVEAIVAAPEPLDPEVHNPAVAALVLLARVNLQNIAAGIDLPLLSMQREQVPVFSFQYLQNVARYFAEHAIQAERTYIGFQTSAEQEEFTRSMLENAIALEQANELLEQKKVRVATEQRKAIQANLDYATLQLANAQSTRTDYANVSLQEIALDAEATYVGAPTTEYDFSGYEQYGISDGTHRVDEVLRTLTRRRREISRDFELRNLDRRINELRAAQRVAQAQVGIADAQVAAAQAQAQIATLRRQQAQQQLALFDSQVFTPELWHRLALEMRAISEGYLAEAIVIARLMEQAFEFETGEQADVIKPGYTRNDLSGLLGGDFLLRDIDSFTYLRIVLGQKKQPMKEIISLADRYPLQFLRDFQRTGELVFRTELADFDRAFPGSYQQRVKRVEVVVEGLISSEGVHGSLTNTGLCLTRRRDGRVQMRLLQPETLLLSRYRVAPDAVVFGGDAEMLAVFEHSPVATSWLLRVRPNANDLVFNFLTDVKLVIYYETFFDPDLERPVLEELAETQPLTGRRTVALRYELFDEFFAFQDTGSVTFRLRTTMVPFQHVDPRITALTLLVRTDDETSPAGLTVLVEAGAVSATQVTTADGALSTGPGAPLNAVLGSPLLSEWTISIPEQGNEAAFAAGFSWEHVSDIVLVAEYAFTPRRVGGDPYLVLRDGFETNPLAAFDVADDPLAGQGGPSAWAHVSPDGVVTQTANIRGLPPGPPAGPAKPGTYLVRRTGTGAGDLPELADVIVTATLRSTTAGVIGLVFRYQDPGNFYFFAMDATNGVRRIGKKTGGVFAELATAAVDTTEGYTPGTSYHVRIRASGTSLRAFVDGEPAVSGSDPSIADPGRVGFYCHANPGARFDDLHLIDLATGGS
ncbi:hypothetical protein [Nonomuraea sp. NPDC050643]|uniref:Tc toxin subunit A-related protein n=1 Tax=Nonomuraea sp. NPDC050643 TaxID=3155660 RepID=UPI0033DA472F